MNQRPAIDSRPFEARRLGQLWRYLRPVLPRFLVGAVFLVATNLLALRIPRAIGAALEHLRAAGDPAAIDVALVEGFALTIALLAVSSAVARILSRILIFNAARIIEYKLRADLFEHLTRMDTAWFQRTSTGDLVSRITNDVTYVRLLYGFGVLHMVNTLVACVLVIGLMFDVNPGLALLALIPYPLMLVVTRLFTRAIYTRTQTAQDALGQLSARAQENLAGMAVVKAFGAEDRESARFRAVSDLYLDRNMALARVRGALNPIMGSIAGVGTLVVLGYGGLQVIEGDLTLGALVEFSNYIVILAFPTLAMGWVLAMWQRGIAAFDRLREILDASPSLADPHPEDALALEGPLGDIALHNVSLTYDDGTRALAGLDLTIKAGSKVAIVGRTGAGKSSLLSLLPRMRDPSEGHITVGGLPLDSLPLADLRRQIAIVPQDPFLFSMTVRENVLLGARSDSTLSLDDALRVACMSGDLVALPNGLDTLIGERGVTLSGGQKQRLTIARAVLTNPSLLILDDALASVDADTERKILEALAQVMTGRTTLMVTHRTNALALFDEVVVLDRGRIVQRGHHDALAAVDGLYRQLTLKQQEGA